MSDNVDNHTHVNPNHNELEHADALDRLEALGRWTESPKPQEAFFGDSDNAHDDFKIHTNLRHDQQDDDPRNSVTEQDIGADDAIALEFFDLMGHEDIWDLTCLQSSVLEDTRAAQYSLFEFNLNSSKILSDLSNDYEQHTKLILEMKKDLDYIFKKTRNLKAQLYAKFPAAKAAALAALPPVSDD